MTRFFEQHQVLTVICLLGLLTVCILALNLAFQSTMDGIDWVEEIYLVEAGDSLWAIAGQYCPDSVDRREWIAEVQQLNDLDNSYIYPGQSLIVLATTEG